MSDSEKNSNNQIPIEEDPIETTIGSFGRAQLWVFVFITFTQICIYYQVVNVVFLLPSIDYVCLDGYSTYENATRNACPCDNPIFDRSVFQETVVTKWSLICDKKWISSFSQGIMQVGVLFGSILFGYMCDGYGRKLAVVSSTFTGAIFVMASGLAESVEIFLLFRFLTGVSAGGNFLSTFTQNMEIAGKSFRPYMAMMQEISYIISYISIAGIGYLFRNFQHLQLIVSVPWLLTFTFYWTLPESPRWFMAKGRTNDAIELLTNFAKRNKLPVDKIEHEITTYQKRTSNEGGDTATMKDLFKVSELRKLVMMVSILWICTNYSFFGMSQYLGRLHGNIFLNVLTTSVLHVPALFLFLFLLLKVKRRMTLVLILTSCALSTFSFMFIPYDNSTVRLVLSVIAVNSLYGMIILLYLYTCEIFPTVVRSSALGVSSMIARFGGFTAPFIVDTNIEYLILSSYALAAIISIIMFIWLPETKDKVLSNTIEDAIKSKETLDKNESGT